VCVCREEARNGLQICVGIKYVNYIEIKGWGGGRGSHVDQYVNSTCTMVYDGTHVHTYTMVHTHHGTHVHTYTMVHTYSG
jgi:hypothetical protein